MDYNLFEEEQKSQDDFIAPFGLENSFSKHDDSNLKFRCKDCGTIFSCETKPEKCVYCGELNIENVEGDSFFSNPFIIPFVKNLDEAKKDYKSKIFTNPLVPIIFKKKSTINRISKIYLPVSMSDIKISGSVKFLAGDKSKIVKDGEKLTETKKYEVNNMVNFDYKNVIVPTYSKIDMKTYNSVCKYDLSLAKEYSKEYVTDSYVIKSDLNPMDISNSIKQVALKHSQGVIRDSIKHDLKKLAQNDAIVMDSNNKELLVPIYLLSVKYKGKNHIYIMNGQNGYSTTNINFGVLETVIFSVLLFLVIFLISFLIAYFL